MAEARNTRSTASDARATVPVSEPAAPRESKAEVPKYSKGHLELERFIAQLGMKFGLDEALYDTDARKVRYVILRLEDAALDWATGLSSSTGWKELSEDYGAFIKRLNETFGDPHPAESASLRIRKLNMKKDYQSYQTEFMRESIRLKYDNKATVDLFLAGLTAPIKAKVRNTKRLYALVNETEEYPDFSQWCVWAAQADAEVQEEEETAAPKTDAEYEGRKTPLKKRKRFESTANKKVPADDGPSTTKRGRVFAGRCYNCNEVGHTQRFCPDTKKKAAGKDSPSP